jgi:hypothetical protein
MRKTMMVWSACAAAVLPACAAGTAMADGMPVQGIGQQAGSTQSAQSSATSTQTNPTNNAVSVAILSPGASSGPVSQANNSTADSTAHNNNATTQNAAQAGGGGGAQQLAGQAVSNAQSAASSATSTQTNPTNNAIHVAILSPGASSGPVSQANNSKAESTADNNNGTAQNAGQSGGGGGGGGVQGVGQQAGSRQGAASSATSTQTKPTNNAIHVAILSEGASSGPVSQENNSKAESTAGNLNSTTQNAAQSGGGSPMAETAAPRKVDGCESCPSYEPPPDSCDSCHPDIPGVQGIGQVAGNEQDAQSSATSTQTNASNNAISLSILSPGSYTGPVSQENNSKATSTAGNGNATTQNALQALGAGGGVQGIGQAAFNGQGAASSALSDQFCPSNFAFGGGGSSGPVEQANDSKADSIAYNNNGTYQNALQTLAAFPWPPVVVI